MRLRGSLVVAAGLLLAAVVAGVVGGCSERVGPPPQLLVTTTTEKGATTTTLPSSVSTLPPKSVADVQAEFEAAIAARDFCAVLDTLDDASPDTNDGQAVIATYEVLADGVERAASFAPTELAESWTSVIDGVEEGLVAARRVAGNIDDPTLRAPFLDGQFQAAMSAAETWFDNNCTTP